MLNRLEVSHTFNYIKLVFNFGLFTATIYKVYFYHFYIFRLDNITIHIFLQKKTIHRTRTQCNHAANLSHYNPNCNWSRLIVGCTVIGHN